MQVRVFTTSNCIYCHTLKKFLGEHNVQFEEVDVSKDRQALEEMVQKSGQMGVPVIEVDNEIVVGFNKNKISEFLGIEE